MAQFGPNDVVLYGSNGVCRIDSIEKREQGDYYILTPLHKDRTKFMVPVDNERLVARMRPMPTESDLRDSLKAAKSADVKWISDNTKRKEYAKQVFESGSVFELLMLERSFAAHKRHVMEIGKKTTSSDSSILRSAQDHIRDEFATVLKIDPEEVDSLIKLDA